MLSVETFAWMPDGAKLGNFVFTSISTEGIRRRGKGQSVCTPYDTLIFLVLTAAAVLIFHAVKQFLGGLNTCGRAPPRCTLELCALLLFRRVRFVVRQRYDSAGV